MSASQRYEVLQISVSLADSVQDINQVPDWKMIGIQEWSLSD